MDQRANIKFCYKLGKTATETREMLVQVYGSEAVSRKLFTNGANAFAKGRKLLRMSHVRVGHRKHNPRNGREIRQMLAQDRQLTLRLIVEELGYSTDTVQTIIRG